MPDNQLEPAVQKALTRLTTLLKENEAVQHYQRMERLVEQDTLLERQQAFLEKAKKDATQYTYYHKPAAARIANQEANQLEKQIETAPLVQEYRAAMYEANAVLEWVTTDIQAKIDQLDKQEEN